MKAKRILVFGDDGYDIVSENIARALNQIGHTAERFYFRGAVNPWPMRWYRFAVRTPLTQGAALSLQKQHRAHLGEVYLKKVVAFKPDLVFIVHFSSITAEQIKMICDSGIPVGWWVMADPAMVSRFDPLFGDVYSHCSHLFFADECWISSVSLIGSAKIVYLPFAADPYLYRPLALQKLYDVGMVANFTIEGPSVIQKAFILERLAKEGFPVRSVTRGIRRHIQDFPNLAALDIVDDFYLAPQVNEFYNQTRITLSVNSPHAKSDLSVRVMEIAASRNFQLAEFRENTEPLMGDTVKSFRSLDELTEQLRFYLAHEKEREVLARQSYERVMAHHTTSVRAKEIIDIVFGNHG